ncbi:MAG: type II toxin-antitoxin system RelE/ParE family toxin [Chloroflexi bacterium]|nr:type II toxin-antitoxin system RelE/ParE family toxin [Chloroflexota bacterium]
MYKVVLSRRAQKAIEALPAHHSQRIRGALESLRDDPRSRGTVKLENAPVAQYRHRVGDYRILFDFDEATGTVMILDIRRRSKVTYR